MITKISRNETFTESNGSLSGRAYLFLSAVADLSIIIGTGSPEGVVEASQTRLYMDETGASGAVLYIKRDSDVSGDRTQGWIAV